MPQITWVQPTLEYPAPMSVKRCPKCGEAKRPDDFGVCKKNKDGLQCWCKPCRRAVNAAWRAASPDYFKRRYANDREKIGEYNRQYYEANREEVKARSRNWHHANLDVARAISTAWYRKNKARARLTYLAWKIANPELARRRGRERARRSRARKRAGYIPFTLEQLEQRMAYFAYRCWMCGGPFEEVDHMKPLAKGGLHCLSNCAPACRACNASKSDKWWGPRETLRRLRIAP